MKKIFSILLACSFIFCVISFAGCENTKSQPSVLTSLVIPDNSSVILDVTFKDHHHEDMEFSENMNLSEYTQVEIRLYADQGYDFAVTKNKPAKIKITSSSGEETIDMIHYAPRLNGNFNTADKAYCKGEIKEIPSGDFSISIEAITYRWTAYESFEYVKPTKIYRITNSGHEQYSGDDKQTLINTFLNEMYVRFDGEYNFGYGNDEILLANLVNHFNTGDNVQHPMKSDKSVVLYTYAHKSNENTFSWLGSVLTLYFNGDVVEETYETDEYIGKKYTVKATLPGNAVISLQPYVLKTWN